MTTREMRARRTAPAETLREAGVSGTVVLTQAAPGPSDQAINLAGVTT